MYREGKLTGSAVDAFMSFVTHGSVMSEHGCLCIHLDL